jgi:hypothetical protein
MNDPAIAAHASRSEAIVADQAAAFEDFFRGQTQNLYAHLCLITVTERRRRNSRRTPS